MISQQDAYLNLALTPGIGPKTLLSIRQSGLQPQQVYELDDHGQKSLGINKTSRQHLINHPPSKPSKEVEKTLSWAQNPNHHIVTFDSEAYPQELKNIESSPALLMVKGQLNALQLNQLAIVGSRYPTASGKQQAYDMAMELTQSGLAITSGLALGIDAAAHQGALDAGGATLAVLGTGLENIYPKQNKQLAEQLCEKGALISEFPLFTQGKPGHFPQRNRIVSGLSLGCLVIEATLKSGSLITARQALEQNREVMAMPGAINNPQKAGCHHLIRQGAVLIESPEQVIQELALQAMAKPVVEKQARLESTSLVDDPTEKRVLSALDYDGANMDELIQRTELNVGELSVVLMSLELGGLVRQEQGLYVLL